MTGRYPYNHGDGRYTPRDRSPPPRFTTRDAAAAAAAAAATAASAAASAPPSSTRDALVREPPKGPKALVDSTRASGPGGPAFAPAGPRARPFSGRADPRDDLASYRPDRDRDRTWRDRDSDRERRHSPPRDYPRDADPSRGQRGSRDASLSAASDMSAAGSAPYARGGFGRGRGRGDVEYRGRGRGTHPDDRDWNYPRSRSRDRLIGRPRDDRDRDLDRRTESRDDTRRLDREDREREAEKYKRERLSGPPEHRLSNASNNPPSSSSATSPHPLGPDARDSRRPSTSAASPSLRDPRRDVDKNDVSARADPSRDRYASRPSSPPQAPQVPAFGSFSYKPPSAAGPSSNFWRAPTSPKAASVSSTSPNPQSVQKSVPTRPRDLSHVQPPTAPKAERLSAETKDTALVKSEENVDPLRLYGTRQSQSVAPLPTKLSSDFLPATSSSASQLTDGLTNRSRAPPAGPFASSQPASKTMLPQGDLSAGLGSPRSPSIPSTPRAADQDKFSKNQPFASAAPLGINVPTGPRADRASRGRSNQWIRGGMSYATGRGSLNLAPAPFKRDYSMTDRDRASGVGRGLSRPDGYPQTSPVKQPDEFESAVMRRVPSKKAQDAADRMVKLEQELDESRALQSAAGYPSATAIDHPMNPPSDMGESDEDEDDDMDLEQTFRDKETEFANTLVDLEERRTTLPRGYDRQVERVRVTEDFVTERMAELATEELENDNATADNRGSLPTPEEDGEGDGILPSTEYVPRDMVTPRTKTPPVESLPFLSNAPPTPVSFVDLDIFQETLERHQTIKSSLARAITQQRRHVTDKQAMLRLTYAALYKKWRIYVDDLDKTLKRSETVEPESVPVVSEPSPPAAPLTSMEGRRGGKFSTELELQLILRESELAAKEAQEKAEREAKAKIDTEKEAVIPDMLDEVQREADIFQDSNQLLDSKQALATFRFAQPPDNFTSEEQRLFTENFLLFPKKWSKIAEALPNRNFQQCIEHYYLTKGDQQYKLMLNKRRPKKGRKAGLNAQAKPKSNALMSDLGARPELFDGDEFEAPAAAVTDSGRPRRAAAPIFGEVNNESESSTPSQTPGRKPAMTPKADATGENPFDRGNKRAKAGATREKGQKRGRNQLLAAAPTPSPQKRDKSKDKDLPRDRERETKGEDERRSKEMEDAQLLASLPARPESVDLHMSFTNERPDQAARHSGSPSRESGRPPHPNQRSGNQTSSYWSRPECNDFPRLLDHFGTDWQAIASHMTSKTSVMVKNFFKREVEHHGRTELKERAELADAKRIRGEPMGPPPTPSAVPKRRYDAPATTMQQPLAPRVDSADAGDMSASLQTHTSPRQHNQAPRYAALAQAASSQPSSHPSRAIASTEPRVAQPQHPQVKPRTTQHAPGPRAGLFTDTRAERPIVQAQSMAPQQPPQPAQRVQQSYSGPGGHQPQQLQPRHQPAVQGPLYGAQSAQATTQPVPASQSRPVPPASLQPEPRREMNVQPQHQHQQLQPQPAPTRPQLSVRPASEVYGMPHPASPTYVVSPAERAPLASSPRSQARPYAIQPHSAPPATQTVPARQPEPRKTSNIMDLLNSNEPEEPRPRKRNRVEHASSPSSSTAQPPVYAPQPVQAGSTRREYDTQPAHRSYQRATSGEMYSMASSTPPYHQTRPYPPLHSASPPPQVQYGHSRGSSYSDRQAPMTSQPRDQRHPQHSSPMTQTHQYGHGHAQGPPAAAPHGHQTGSVMSQQQPMTSHSRHHSQSNVQLRHSQGPPPQAPAPQQMMPGYSQPHPSQMQHSHQGPPPRSYTPSQYHHQGLSPGGPYDPPPRAYEGHERR